MTFEKLSKPIVNEIINKKIVNSQFGFIKGVDCSFSKVMIFFKAKKYKYSVIILIDIKKLMSQFREKTKKFYITKF